MAAKASIVAVVVAMAMAGILVPRTADRALACSLALTTLDHAAEFAEIVIVGEVVAERPIDHQYEAYESTVRVSATLKGAPEPEITLSPLGFLGADCSGGPRLEAGEHVLLFLGRGVIATGGDGDLQVVNYEGGKYLLENGAARSLYDQQMPADEALRRVASIAGAPPDQLEAALAFAVGEPTQAPEPAIEPLPTTDEEDSGPSALLIGLAVAGGVAAPAAALIGLRRLRRPR